MAWLAPLHNWSHRRRGKFVSFFFLSLAMPYGKKIWSSEITMWWYFLQLLLLKPKRYGIEHKENLTGEGEQYIYHSKGHALNPGQRDWTKYQPWQSKPESWSFELLMFWLFFFSSRKIVLHSLHEVESNVLLFFNNKTNY